MFSTRPLAILLVCACLAGAAGKAAAQSVISNTFSPSGATLERSVVTIPYLPAAIPGSLRVEFYNEIGALTGTRIVFPTAHRNILGITVGSQIIVDPLGNEGGLRRTFKIVDPAGLPGTGTVYGAFSINNRSWMFGAEFVGVMPAPPADGQRRPFVITPPLPPLDPVPPDAGLPPGRVVGSHLDLLFSRQASGNYDVSIIGAMNDILLSRSELLSLPDTTHVGTLFVGPGGDAGTFAFTGIGMSGGWLSDLASGQTSFFVNNFNAFAAPSVSVVAEPAGLLLTLGALLALAHTRRHRAAGARPLGVETLVVTSLGKRDKKAI